MPDFADFAGLPEDYSGPARLFPLPNLVLFPHVMQPLHIFEPRYRELLEDALAGDMVIAMALLLPGWQPQYDEQPPISPVVCLGRVMTHVRQDDGRYNILLVGAQRARITQELPQTGSFRLAEVELLDDLYPAEGAAERPALQRRLFDRFRALVSKTSGSQEQFEQALSQQVPLGILTDIAAFSLPLPVAFKQELLAECNADRRATLLLERLEAEDAGSSAVVTRRKFPPEFSDN